MHHDLTLEKLIPFAELARGLQRRRRGRPAHRSTIHRWRDPGLRGIQLEAVLVGGVWCTSEEAFSRFCDRLTQSAQGASPRISMRRDRDDAAVERDLRREGL